MYPNHNQNQRDPRQLAFHPQVPDEFNVPKNVGAQITSVLGFRPMYRDFKCGDCGANTSGRVLCDVTRADESKVLWCQCACERREPTIIILRDDAVSSQLPQGKEFIPQERWPSDIREVFGEAAKSFSAGAYTSAAMMCRKALMVTACEKGADEGKRFVEYVDFITNEILTYSNARTAIEKIKNIGNEANHKVQMVTEADARKSMEIVRYMLDVIYAFPAA